MELMVGRGLILGRFSEGYGDEYYVNPNFVMVSYEYFELATGPPSISPSIQQFSNSI
jgi:hypothetical protein